MSASVIVAAVSVVIAATGLLFTMRQGNLLRRKEYADRIRGAASETSAAIDRWKELCLRMYEDVQPLLTEADMKLVDTGNVTLTRDHLWRGLVEARVKATERITAEKIETAYVNLYGYDARIHPLFAAVMKSVRDVDKDSYARLLDETQNDVLKLNPDEDTFESAMLGNQLRKTCAELESSLSRALNIATAPCAAWLLSIIEASDADIVKKHIIFPEISADAGSSLNFLLSEPQADKEWDNLLCKGQLRLIKRQAPGPLGFSWGAGAGMTRLSPQPPDHLDQAAASILEHEVPPEAPQS